MRAPALRGQAAMHWTQLTVPMLHYSWFQKRLPEARSKDVQREEEPLVAWKSQAGHWCPGDRCFRGGSGWAGDSGCL